MEIKNYFTAHLIRYDRLVIGKTEDIGHVQNIPKASEWTLLWL